MHLAWVDLTRAQDPVATAEEAVHAGVHGILTADPEVLASLPPSVSRVGLVRAGDEDDARDALAKHADVLVFEREPDPARPITVEAELGVWVVVEDQASLDRANAAARRWPWTIVDFTDPTKIPLEIVLAAADRAEGRVVTVVHDVEEAEIVFDVLERGSDGVLLATTSVGEATQLAGAALSSSGQIGMTDMEVTEVRHVGLGERVCVDTCSHLLPDEGILVGSYAMSMILVSSETHPLPYMPTRPFRVNAGALHSYTLGPDNRTCYLSEVTSGTRLLAVRADGTTRLVTVGRAKIESRPLLELRGRSADGVAVDLIVQDDWHVRVLGPRAEVRNVTELAPGDLLAGSVLTDPRHVGYAVSEFLIEK